MNESAQQEVDRLSDELAANHKRLSAGITCSTCKGNFRSYPEFTAHIGSPTCANEIIVSPTEDSSREQS